MDLFNWKNSKCMGHGRMLQKSLKIPEDNGSTYFNQSEIGILLGLWSLIQSKLAPRNQDNGITLIGDVKPRI